MSKVFKKRITSFRSPVGRKCKKSEAVTVNGEGKEVLRPGYERVRIKSTKYYGAIPDAQGIVRDVPLCEDKVAAQQILIKKLADTAKDKHGLGDVYEKHRIRPLVEHLTEYRRELESKGDTPSHVEQVFSRIAALLEGCGFQYIDDFSASRVTEWLADLRHKGRERIHLGKGQEEYTMKQVAAILQITPAAIRAAVRRHHLQAKGNGKARRFPRATVEALQDRLCRGVGTQTTNYYLTHLKSFCRWMRKDRRIPENPFDHLERNRKETELRHRRRELTAQELEKLLDVARTSTWSFRDLSGLDRFALYVTACATGFRASSLTSLCPENFSLDADPPTITLAARNSKNRKTKVQPVPADVAVVLREYLAQKLQGEAVWGGTWASGHRGAEMLRGDLEAAGIPYVVEDADGPLYADFHALRHTYLTLLGKGGVELRTAQELAGHSTPVLTARYSHRRLNDLAEAVGKLPSFLPRIQEAAKKPSENGIDGQHLVCPRLAGTTDGEGQDGSVPGSRRHPEKTCPETTQPLKNSGVGHGQTVPVSTIHKRGRRDSNPQPPDRQSGTLTN